MGEVQTAAGFRVGDYVRVKADVPSFGGMIGQIKHIFEQGSGTYRVSVTFINTNSGNTFDPRQLDRA